MEEGHEPWSIGHRINHILKILKKKCNEIQTRGKLKKCQYNFCRNIFTPQTYGLDEEKKEINLIRNTIKYIYLKKIY